MREVSSPHGTQAYPAHPLPPVSRCFSNFLHCKERGTEAKRSLLMTDRIYLLLSTNLFGD